MKQAVTYYSIFNLNARAKSFADTISVNDDVNALKLSRESDLRSVSYNRPVGVRLFVKDVKSLSENQHNS